MKTKNNQVTFYYEVVGKDGVHALFINKEDAYNFKRTDEFVLELCAPKTRDWATLMFPRKSLKGDIALNVSECIGVW